MSRRFTDPLQCNRLRKIDAFGQIINFNIHEGNPTLRSSIGGCFTILILTMTLIWVVQSVIILLERKGTLFLTEIHSRVHDYEDKFSEKDGFQIAIALIDISTSDLSDYLQRP